MCPLFTMMSEHLLAVWLTNLISHEVVQYADWEDKDLSLADRFSEAWELMMENLTWSTVKGRAHSMLGNDITKKDMVFLRKTFLNVQQFNDDHLSHLVMNKCLDTLAYVQRVHEGKRYK